MVYGLRIFTVNHPSLSPTIFVFKDQIKNELNYKLSNRVMINVGLCISLFDILEVGESHILPGIFCTNYINTIQDDFFDR